MTHERDDYLVDAILCHKELAKQGQALALAQDTIRIALKTAGYKNVDNMDQFERASALLDMAQELAALTNRRHIDEKPFDVVFNTLKVESVAWANGRGYIGRID